MTDHKIEVPATGAGRIYAGLRWDDIYDAGSNVGKAVMAGVRIKDFPFMRSFLAYIAFIMVSSAAFFQFTSALHIQLDLSALRILIAVETTAFCILAIFYWRKAWIFSGFGQKKKDKDGRDAKFAHFDIDLHCLIYDQDGALVREIAPKNDKLLSESGSVYHSGEETSGGGVYDDETVHIELNKVPEDYACFVFFIGNDCAHGFDKITNLKVRLVNSASERTLLETPINSAEADGFLFCAVFKKDGQWVHRPINRYLTYGGDWKSQISQMIGIELKKSAA